MRDKIQTRTSLLTLSLWLYMAVQLWAVDQNVAHWKMVEGVGTIITDITGGHHGTLVGLAPEAAWINDGQLGSAIRFDGLEGHHIAVPHADDLDFGDDDFSISLFVRYPTPPTDLAQRWIIKGSHSNDPNTGKRYELFHHNSNVVRFVIDDDNTKSRIVVDDAPFITGEWVHVVAVRDTQQGQLSLYADGVKLNSLNPASESDNGTDLTGNISNGEQLRIGESTVDGGSVMTGDIDDVRLYATALSQDDITNLYACWPALGEVLTSSKVTLGWGSMSSLETYDLYLGTDYQEVKDATLDSPLLMATALDANTFQPDTDLDYGQTYYWRVDRVTSPSTIVPGDIWHFSIEPYSLALASASVTATASNFRTGYGPERMVDESGLDPNDLHSNHMPDMWFGSYVPDESLWVKYQFDKIYKLDEMWIWNFNSDLEYAMGIGAKDVTLEASLDGITWNLVADLQLAQGTSQPGYSANTVADCLGISAQYLRMTIHNSWQSTQFCGLSEVRFYVIPTWPRYPQPVDGSLDVNADLTLSWISGRDATAHEVSWGKDEQAVISQETHFETTSDSRLNLNGLDLSSTYYWQVTEINELAEVEAWQGSLWSFNTRSYITIDDFETYDNACNRIYYAWKDGAGFTENENCPTLEPYSGNGSNSYVGYSDPPFGEWEFVRSDSTQSMPFYYDNDSDEISEATFVPALQDWTQSSISSLSLYFRALEDEDNDAAQLYLKINDTKILYDGSMTDVTQTFWIQWVIDLDSVATDLTQVTSLTLGVEGKGDGTLLFDDLRLYQNVPLQPHADTWFEAENADTMTDPMNVYEDDPEASGGAYIMGIGDEYGQEPDDLGRGYATYTVKLPAGTYNLMASVMAPLGSQDSFWVRLNGATLNVESLEDNPSHPNHGWINWDFNQSDDWQHVPVTSSLDEDIIVDFTVDGGIYLLEINLRDEGARLDALKFTLVE